MRPVWFLSLLFLVMACEPPQTPNADPCENITCDRGTCKEGVCECPTGFTGSSCQNQIMPKRIEITRIEVLGFAATNNGGAWDPSGLADLTVLIDLNGQVIYQHPDFLAVDEAKPSEKHTFIPQQKVYFTKPLEKHTFRLYDYDYNIAPKLIEIADFIPYQSNNNFPGKISITKADLKADIYLTYEFP